MDEWIPVIGLSGFGKVVPGKDVIVGQSVTVTKDGKNCKRIRKSVIGRLRKKNYRIR